MSRSRKILHVLSGLHVAGIENLSLQLIRKKPEEFQCGLLNIEPCARDMLPQFNALVAEGCLGEIIELQADGFWLLLRSWAFACRYNPAAVIIYPCNSRLLWLALGMRLAGVNAIAVCIQNTAPPRRKQRFRWRYVLSLFWLLRVRLVSCSDAVARSIRPLLPRQVDLPVIPNGCDVSGLARRAANSHFSARPVGRFRLGMVARLDQIKDQATLIQAFALTHSSSWDLLLVGDGPCREELIQLSLSCGLDPDQVFLGRRQDIPELLGSFDLFAFSTTDSEGFGIALIEAMAVGLPVIASNVAACREILADGEAGELVPAGDVQAWAERLQWLMHEPAQRQRLAAAARQRSEAYGMEACAQRWYAELGR